jgi:proline iminopeptidase
VTPWEIVRIHQGIHRSLEAMYQELLAFDLWLEVPSLDVPVVFFLGRQDHHADANLAAEYFESLRAPRKKIVWFERSAHDVPFGQVLSFGGTAGSSTMRTSQIATSG